jgi:rhodanese-related sulfurtransferase
MRSLRSAQFLHAVGYRRVTNLDGGTSGWLAAQQATPAAASPPAPAPA